MNVLIVTEPNQNWQTFATWYSVFENIPDANVAIRCIRNKETPMELYQWAKRLNIPIACIGREFQDNFSNRLSIARNVPVPCLVLTPLTMVLEKFKKPNESFIANEHVIFSNSVDEFDNWLNAIQLEGKGFNDPENTYCKEAKETKKATNLVSYKKGCGRWIDTLRGCPFSNAAGLATEDMTVNERRIIEMWKRMVNLYSATA